MRTFCYLLFLSLFMLTCSPSAENEPLTEATASDELADLVDQYLQTEEQEGFSGSVMLIRHNEPVLMKGYGLANRETGAKVDEHTLFTIGSITKMMTATAIMKLVEQGKLKLDQPISDFFEGVPADKQAITVHHLLTMGAGLPPAIGSDDEAVSEADFQKEALGAKLLFPIGEGYEYSNVGYTLLGMIIEKTSGMTYDQYLEENLFQPAGMSRSGYINADKNIAHGYTSEGEDWGIPLQVSTLEEEPLWHLKANGGILSSAAEMAKWYTAIQEGKILSPESLAKQLYGHNDEGGGDSFYGYGIVEFTKGEHYAHNGGNGIFRADYHYFPADSSAFFIVANDANTPLFNLSDDILAILETGELPEKINYEAVALTDFPTDEKDRVGAAFVQQIQNYKETTAMTFINEHFSEGIIERNGMDRLRGIMEQLHEEMSGLKIVEVAKANEHLRMVLSGPDFPDQLIIKLLFAADKIESLSVDVEGG